MSDFRDIIFDSYSVDIDDFKYRLEKVQSRINNKEKFSCYYPKKIKAIWRAFLVKKYFLYYELNKEYEGSLLQVGNFHDSDILSEDLKIDVEIFFNDLENISQNFLSTVIGKIGERICFEFEDFNKESEYLIKSFNKKKWDDILKSAIADLQLDYDFNSSKYREDFIEIINKSLKDIKDTGSLLPIINIVVVLDFVFKKSHTSPQTFVDLSF